MVTMIVTRIEEDIITEQYYSSYTCSFNATSVAGANTSKTCNPLTTVCAFFAKSSLRAMHKQYENSNQF